MNVGVYQFGTGVPAVPVPANAATDAAALPRSSYRVPETISRPFGPMAWAWYVRPRESRTVQPEIGVAPLAG